MSDFNPDALIPLTAEAALKKWDAGEGVFTIEMGGLGPGYEQAIHVTVFELIRALKNDKGDWKANAEDTAFVNEVFDREVSRINEVFSLGLSGAQAGAAKGLACAAMIRGWREAVKSVEDDRRIQVSKYWPGREVPNPDTRLDAERAKAWGLKEGESCPVCRIAFQALANPPTAEQAYYEVVGSAEAALREHPDHSPEEVREAEEALA